MNEKGKSLISKICAILAIISLLVSDFLFVGTSLVSYALDVANTNNNNVVFTAYFRDGNEQTDKIQRNIDEGETKLYVDISVKNEGYFNGQITLNNGSFDLKQEVNSEHISSISGNAVTLNQINAGSTVTIELGIQPKTTEAILNSETEVNLNGSYVNGKALEKNKTIDVNGTAKVNLEWKSSNNAQAELESTILTNSIYKVNGEEKRVVQVLVNSKITANNYPVKNTEVTLSVPENVQKVEVHARSTDATNKNINFNENNYTYNEQNKTLTIKLSNENNTSWSKNAQDTFIVTYEFEKTENVTNKEITVNSTINTYDNKELKANQQIVHIENEIDGIVSSSIESTEEAIYKGKIYTGEERTYTEKNTINIDYVNDAENLTIKGNEAVYLTDANESPANIIYKETKINKQEFLKIFGQEGELTIKSNGKTIAIINNNTQPDEGEDIIVHYFDNTSKNIEITTSKPIAVGTLNIEHTKAILSAGYARETIDKFTAIKESVTVKNTQATNKITLKDTESEASIKLKDISTISTMADSQTIELEAILNTSDESKDLYKNPTVTITLPKEITISSIEPSVLYKNGLEPEKATRTKNDNGETQIALKFKGEQKNYDNYDGAEGTVINLKLEIKTDKLTPSKSSAIQMTYTNENKNQTKTASAEFKFESQYGLMIYNKVSNYNNAKDSAVTVNSEPAYGTIDTNSESKEATIGTAIINNYGEAIQNVVLVGTIPSNNSEDTYKATLNKVEIDNPNAKISYSSKANAEANDNSWGESTENVVSYKVEIPQMAKEEIAKLKITVTIPEKIGYNKNGSFLTKTSCIFQGQVQQNSSSIILSTQANIETSSVETLETSEETENGLNTKISAMVGNNSLVDDDIIFEGQTIRYKITVTNNTGKDYTNVKIDADQTNGYVWDNVKTQLYNPYDDTKSTGHYYEKTDKNNIELGTIPTLKNGESYTYSYEASASSIDNKETFTYGTIKITSEDKALNESVTTIKNNIKPGELQVDLNSAYTSELNLVTGNDVRSLLSIKNTTSEDLKDLEAKIVFSSNLTASVSIPKDISDNVAYQGETTGTNGEKIVTLKISKIEANETIIVELYPYTEKTLKEDEVDTWILAQVTTSNNNSYVSNKLTRKVYDNSHDIRVSQQGINQNGAVIDTDKDKLSNGDNVNFVATITNNEEEEINVGINYNIDKMIDVKKAKIISQNSEQDVIEKISYNNLNEDSKTLKPGETIQIDLSGTVETLDVESVTNKLNVYDIDNGKSVNNMLSILVNPLKEELIDLDAESEDEKTQEPEVKPGSTNDDTSMTGNETSKTNTSEDTNSKQTNSEGNNGTKITTKTYTISGTAWLDQDRDGKKNSSEEKISDVTVEAINLGKGNVSASVKTDSNGEYKLTLEEGSYVLLFNYDNNLYTTTTYQVTGASDTENSDAIERNVKFNGTTKKAGITDTIKLNSNIANLDLGLVLRSTFDLKLQKYVSKITVTNDAGTKTYEQPANTTLAKAEVKAKNLSGSLVVIEYKIKVTNAGDVAGYAKNIVDYMPSSLSFNSSMNSDWYLSGENLYNTSLANTKLEPGETKELTLVLTKTMTETNTGLINNKAAIKESSNLLGINDEKDDIGSADVIISVTTGALVSYVVSTITTFIVIAAIAYFINKKYLSKRI